MGFMRVAVGFAKKWAADNLTGWIEYIEPHFATQTPAWRWLFLAALAMRILLDFSGYSDMAIGYARMMGVVVPENFDWPYIARSPIEFWQRWHISLSLWIRDYIYIPLGGSRLGLPRRLLNALIAMVLCGLWHGPSWHFAVWGIYHGVGLSIAALLQRLLATERKFVAMSAGAAKIDASLFAAYGGANALAETFLRALGTVVSWMSTMIFVGVGWLLFFYPVEKAFSMMLLLFTW
jgi:alginate O-acetyltransferase complex protein AlgI